MNGTFSSVPAPVMRSMRVPLTVASGATSGIRNASVIPRWELLGTASGEGRDEDPLEMELAAELSQEEFHRPGEEGQKVDDSSG